MAERSGGRLKRRMVIKGALVGTAGLAMTLVGCDMDGGRDRRKELEDNMALVIKEKQTQVEFLTVIANARIRAGEKSYLSKQLKLVDGDPSMRPGSVISWASQGCRGPYDPDKVPVGTSQNNHRGSPTGPDKGRGIVLEFCVVDNVRRNAEEVTPMLWVGLAYGVRCTPGINPELVVAWHVVTAELKAGGGLK